MFPTLSGHEEYIHGFPLPLVCNSKGFRPGGMKALIAENLLLKQQLFLLTPSCKRAPYGQKTHTALWHLKNSSFSMGMK